MCIRIGISSVATIVKLQRIGNSIRATIPKDIVEDLSLREGDDMVVAEVDDSILLRRRRAQGADGTPSQFFGRLKSKTGEVKHWPTPEEIKSIWE